MLCASAFCLLNSWPSSGADIAVRVLDASDQTPLPGATLAVLGTEFGGYADEEGYCRVEGLPDGQYDLLCSHIGYRSHTLRGVAPGEEERVVALEPTAVEVPELVVSAARRSQTFAQAPISISVADAQRIAAYNAFSLTGPLRYVSGISQVDNRPVVRGSSGYSRGTGSRLLLLVDGFPMLSSDVGDIKWDAVPLQQVERVEVVKGAGSALYGTGALGGVINVLTRDPARAPGTRFRLLSGLYSQPAYSQWHWSESPMHFIGFDVSHNRVLGRTGLALSGGHNRGTGYHQNGDGGRYRLYAKAVHRFSPTSYWRVMGNWALDDHGVFVQWRDRSQPLSVPANDVRPILPRGSCTSIPSTTDWSTASWATASRRGITARVLPAMRRLGAWPRMGTKFRAKVSSTTRGCAVGVGRWGWPRWPIWCARPAISSVRAL